MKEASQVANGMDLLSTDDLNNGVLTLVYITSNLRDYIVPTLNVIFNLQNDIGNLNMKQTSGSEYGM